MPDPKQRKMAIVGSRAVGKLLRNTWFMQSLHANMWTSIANCGMATGKSSLTVQFVDGHFVDSYYPTIENTFSKIIRYKNQEFATEIIDTAGQVRYTSFPCSPPHGQTRAPPHPCCLSIGIAALYCLPSSNMRRLSVGDFANFNASI